MPIELVVNYSEWVLDNEFLEFSRESYTVWRICCGACGGAVIVVNSRMTTRRSVGGSRSRYVRCAPDCQRKLH